jgi:hypothetical protein
MRELLELAVFEAVMPGTGTSRAWRRRPVVRHQGGTVLKAPKRVIVALALATGSMVATAVATSFPAAAAPTWAPAATATIHPGVQTFTSGGQCTANFVYFDTAATYIGQAAHCAGTGGNTATNGCTSGSLALGTPVTVTGASRPGTLVYSSWLTMQALHETDANTCQFNDLALVKLDPADTGKVNPSIPHWGGPAGIATAGTTVGETVYSYGNSELRGGVTVLSPKRGVSLGDSGAGWSHDVATVSPGIPGDSGSAFLDANGNALGVLSTLQLAPVAGSNGVGDVNLELQYLHVHTSFTGVQLALGTVAFNGTQLPLGP